MGNPHAASVMHPSCCCAQQCRRHPHPGISRHLTLNWLTCSLLLFLSYLPNTNAERLNPVRNTVITNRVLNRSNNPYGLHWENSICFCAIMKNEHLDTVKEWLDYHRWAGVDKIFLREHGPEMTMEDELSSYVESGFLEYLPLDRGDTNRLTVQTDWYNDCAGMAQEQQYSWAGFFDLDEFVVVLKKQKSVPKKGALKQVLRHRFRYNSAVTLQWVIFGSANRWEHPEEGQLKGFNKCSGKLGKQLKCLANTYWLFPDDPFLDTRVHECTSEPGAAPVGGDGRSMPLYWIKNPATMKRVVIYRGIISQDLGSRIPITDDHSLVIFHYVVRSQEQFLKHKVLENTKGAGVYAVDFGKQVEAKGWKTDEELVEGFRAFEKSRNLDGDDDICSQGAALSDAYKAEIAETRAANTRGLYVHKYG